MKKLSCILLFLLSINSFAGEQLFNEANNAYSNEDYATAILLYDSIIARGLESSELFYNLGNCYYKNKDWANAIWHYEKSLALHSNAKTIQNLALANLKIIDRIEPLPQLFYQKWWRNLTEWLSTKTWQILTLICMGLITILQLLMQFTTLKNKLFLTILYPSTVVLLLITHSSYTQNVIKKEAIIISSVVVVNSAPSPNSTNLFSLHSGSKVEILDQIDDWINIKIANGNSGWIKQTSCKNL